ncbi:MAG: hypothetical protein ACXACH_03010 [Candidatus Hermodarchaeia archaeon]
MTSFIPYIENQEADIMVTPYKLFNVVISIDFQTKFDLDKIHSALPDTTYNPKENPFLLYEPKGRNNVKLLLFKSGNAVCSGAKSQQEAAMFVNTLRRKFKQIGVEITWWHDIKVENVVALGNFDSSLDMHQIKTKLENTTLFGEERENKTLRDKKEDIMKEWNIGGIHLDSEPFPWAIHKMKDPKTAFMLFRSGKYISTGSKSEEQVSEAHAKLTDRLQKLQLI